MYSLRYNPVFKQWVLVGPPVLPFEEITESQLLTVGKGYHFIAASYPRHILQPDFDDVKREHRPDMLHLEHPPVGEYDLLLYAGEKGFWEWGSEQWGHWLVLLQNRVAQMHKNLNIRHLHIELRTSQLNSIQEYQRVGDVIGTTHPIQERQPELDNDLLDRLRQEELFAIFLGETGWLYAPSAPLEEKELWYLPYIAHSGIEKAGEAVRGELAKVMAQLMRKLHGEWPDEDYRIIIYSNLAHQTDQLCWWVRIHKEQPHIHPSLPVTLAPEGFVYILHRIFGHL